MDGRIFLIFFFLRNHTIILMHRGIGCLCDEKMTKGSYPSTGIFRKNHVKLGSNRIIQPSVEKIVDGTKQMPRANFFLRDQSPFEKFE